MEEKLPRRSFLTRIALAVGSAVAMPFDGIARSLRDPSEQPEGPEGADGPIKSIKPMGFQWETADPFLFCVHHEDRFPKGEANMGPSPMHFKGRSMGDDFIVKDGFRMYHGKTVPGFPGHPHRGFETVTVVRKGFVDHADSMGAAGRYGNGDVQWMTAGKGVQHAEMFPLLYTDKENHLELFQIWLNLPRKSKLVDPHFKMLWRESIPLLTHKDPQGKTTRVEIIAGQIGKLKAPAPPPNSWAADPNNHVALWNIKMEAGAVWTLPAAVQGVNRMLYYYEGEGLRMGQRAIPRYHAISLHPDQAVVLNAGPHPTSLLMLQGRPIGETVIQYGPFVMNTKEEINKAFEDYHRTQFGGWPWPKYDQVHPRDRGRFARHADGKEEVKGA